MAKRGRTPDVQLTDEHRSKIQKSQILNRLISHVEGKCDLSATQVTAGLGLLKKALPDLVSSDNTTEVIHRYVARVPEKAKTNDEWMLNQQSSGAQVPSKPH